MNPQEYVLRPRPPIRAFAISAVATLVGAFTIVLSTDRDWPWPILIVGVFVTFLGLALAIAAVFSIRRMQVVVQLDDEGYRIKGADRDREGKWATVTRVTETTDGRHITIYHGDVSRTHLLCPGGTQTEQFQQMLADIGRRLDRTYGYGEDSK